MKRTRTSKGKAGRTGRPRRARLLELPVELLHKICECMDPAGLLELARTCKQFNRFLSSKQSRTSWRRSFKNLYGFGELPTGLSEIRLAHLIFSEDCWFCDKNVNQACWYWKTRCCSQCLKQHTIPWFRFEKQLKTAEFDWAADHIEEFKGAVPNCLVMGRVTYLKADVKSFLELLRTYGVAHTDDLHTRVSELRSNVVAFEKEAATLAMWWRIRIKLGLDDALSQEFGADWDSELSVLDRRVALSALRQQWNATFSSIFVTESNWTAFKPAARIWVDKVRCKQFVHGVAGGQHVLVST